MIALVVHSLVLAWLPGLDPFADVYAQIARLESALIALRRLDAKLVAVAEQAQIVRNAENRLAATLEIELRDPVSSLATAAIEFSDIVRRWIVECDMALSALRMVAVHRGVGVRW